MRIRRADPGDHAAILEIARPIVRAGETYGLDRDLDDAALLAYWLDEEKVVFVAEIDGVVIGLAYLRPNQGGGGAHVANAGFMTREGQAGRGVARALCAHVLEEAREHGYRSMQFNFVVSTNARAILLWESLGFETLARLPEAFHHPALGYVDALVMFKRL